MAECSFRIKRVPTNPSTPVDRGGEEMFIPDPLGPSCTVEIFLNDEPVRNSVGSMVPQIGDFDISGGSANHVILKPTRGKPKGKLEIFVTCTDPACDRHKETLYFNPNRSDAELIALFFIGMFLGTLLGGIIGWFLGAWVGALIGGFLGAIVGAVVGLLIGWFT